MVPDPEYISLRSCGVWAGLQWELSCWPVDPTELSPLSGSTALEAASESPWVLPDLLDFP